jgi:hypothetical protein
LRTFAITGAPEFLAPATDISCLWEWLPRGDYRGWVCLLTASLSLTFLTAPERVHKGQSSQPVALACEATGLLGMHPAGNGLLEGGRNKLREYAQ